MRSARLPYNPNAITGLNASGQIMSLASGNMYFEFVLPGTLTPASTDSLSFSIGDFGFDFDSWTINAYGIGDALIQAGSKQEHRRRFRNECRRSAGIVARRARRGRT